MSRAFLRAKQVEENRRKIQNVVKIAKKAVFLIFLFLLINLKRMECKQDFFPEFKCVVYTFSSVVSSGRQKQAYLKGCIQ